MGDHIEEVSELVSKAIVEYRKEGRVDSDFQKRLEELALQQENPLIAEHLRVIVRNLKEGNIEERSLLEKSLSLDKEELGKIVDSIRRFLTEEPFKDMESKELLLLWEKSLEKIMEAVGDEEGLRGETESTSR